MTHSGVGKGGFTPGSTPPWDDRRLRVVEGGGEASFSGARVQYRPSANLPLVLSSFIGREREISEVKRLLAETRLLTLTGTGGSGKTRLALAVAFAVAEGFEDGACWVGLATISDPDHVPRAVAQALQVNEQPGVPLADTLADSLQEKELLLVLDNCEHLIYACAMLSGGLLTSCPGLRILATSREAMGIGGESAWPVPSLSLPDPNHLPPVEQLRRYEAISLFVERARDAASGFELTEENASAVARVCRQVDGMPLAVELAAARVRALSVEQISSRLEASFGLLSGGSRTALPRQKTLRATMEWSHELLGREEKVLFRRLSVFAGGFTLEAAEEVCGEKGLEREEVLDLLLLLVDKSLVLVSKSGGESRFRFLEPVRQYGAEKLDESGEAAEIRRRHAGFMLALAERAGPELKGPLQAEWLERLGIEHDNLRAAMRWRREEDDAEAVARFAWALWLFWFHRGHQDEGRSWIEGVLAEADILSTDLRAKVLYADGAMSWGLDNSETIRLQEESLALFRQAGNRHGEALALGGMGVPTMQQGDVERATVLFEESIDLLRSEGDEWETGFLLAHLGMIYLDRGERERAMRHFEESLALSRETGHKFSGSISLYNLARAAQDEGDHDRAADLYAEGLTLAVELSDRANAAYCLEGLAGVAVARGDPERAVRLFGTAEALLEAAGGHLYAHAQDRSHYEGAVRALRSRLDDGTFTSAWSEGRAKTPQEAVEYALSEEELASTPKETAGLTERELEVLRLVAEGLTDAQVAQRLYLSPRTVGFHLRSIYRKLGVPSRTAAATVAVERHLI